MASRAITYTADLYSVRKKQAFLYLLRSMLYPRQTRKWLDYINQNDLFLENDENRLDLATKIYRPFMRPFYTIDDRILLLTNHINIVKMRFPQDFMRKILNKDVIELAIIRGKESSYRITIF